MSTHENAVAARIEQGRIIREKARQMHKSGLSPEKIAKALGRSRSYIGKMIARGFKPDVREYKTTVGITDWEAVWAQCEEQFDDSEGRQEWDYIRAIWLPSESNRDLTGFMPPTREPYLRRRCKRAL